MITARDQQARALRDRPAPTHNTPLVAVTGGKGGVGKTLVAVNLAVTIARSGYRTLLVDLDPGLANVDVHLRLAPRFTVEDLAAGRCRAEQALVAGPGGIRLLAGASGSTRMAQGDASLLTQVMQSVTAAAAPFDVAICDTGAGIGPAVLAAATRADLVLAVTTPDPASVTDTYALCKVLNLQGQRSPSLVINRVRNRETAMRTAGKLTTVCRKFLSTEPQLLGWLADDRRVEQSVLEQRAFAVSGTGTPMEDLRSLSAGVLSALPALQRERKREIVSMRKAR